MPKSPEPKEIVECYTDFTSAWRDIREEAKIDIRYVAGDPWDPKDRRLREDAGRPCISLDEINQYLNQYNNSLRQNKRAIQVIPKGDGANDKDATRRENIIRGIENESNAQEAYITAAENAASRSYGYALIRTEYKDTSAQAEASISSFDQRIVIKRVGNPDVVLLNPNYEKADASDVTEAFYVKRMSKKDFKHEYPKARKVSFTSADATLAPGWIGDKDLQVAEFWKIHKTYRTLLLIDGGKLGPTAMWKDELDRKPEKSKVLKERQVEIPEVVEYVTNGIEILSENPWAGSRIPIIACFGKEIFVDEGTGAQRKLLSMVRLARDPQMLFAYFCSQEAEEAGMTPKTPFMGAKGQFESAKAAWEVINKQPLAYIEYDIILDAAQQSVEKPTRPQFQPNFEAYEMAKDSARRSIQAAMGISPLPTAAQRDSEKSGIALDRIQTQEAIGSFHFSDNFDRFLGNMGWQINELIGPIYDTDRQVPIEKADGTHAILRTVGSTSHPIDEDGAYDVQGLQGEDGKEEEHLHTDKGDFDVTISTGPSYQSQREQASEFVDHLIENWQQLGIPQPLAQKILALGIKLKDIGPLGDAIVELLNPPDPSNLPPAAQAAMAQLQSQLQTLMQENQVLHLERAGKVIEHDAKLKIAQASNQTKLDSDTMAQIVKLVIAELGAKSRSTDQIAETDADVLKHMAGLQSDQMLAAHDAAHEVAMSGVQHQQAKDLATQQGVQDSMATSQQAGHTADQSAQDATQQAALQPPAEPQQGGQ
jgi:hypothetical protein